MPEPELTPLMLLVLRGKSLLLRRQVELIQDVGVGKARR
jgi:hypothetical protein